MTRTEQRAVALASANERRCGSAAVKAEIRAGALRPCDAVLDPRVDHLMVGDLLQAIPYWGPWRVRRALAMLAARTEGPFWVQLWPWSLMRDLTDRQRNALRVFLRDDAHHGRWNPNAHRDAA